jgi:hypothetical protein
MKRGVLVALISQERDNRKVTTAKTVHRIDIDNLDMLLINIDDNAAT